MSHTSKKKPYPPTPTTASTPRYYWHGMQPYVAEWRGFAYPTPGPPSVADFGEDYAKIAPILTIAGGVAATYHGYRRNRSIGWALAWGFVGTFFPLVVNAIAVAQGFGKPKGQ